MKVREIKKITRLRIELAYQTGDDADDFRFLPNDLWLRALVGTSIVHRSTFNMATSVDVIDVSWSKLVSSLSCELISKTVSPTHEANIFSHIIACKLPVKLSVVKHSQTSIKSNHDQIAAYDTYTIAL